MEKNLTQVDSKKSDMNQRQKNKNFSSNTLKRLTNVLSLKSSNLEIVSATQLGLYYSLGKLAHVPDRDILMEDFFRVNIYFFPSNGSSVHLTPPHKFSDFTFKDFAPVSFRYFRKFFGIKPEDFMQSLCKEPFKELPNSGASGSMFFKSADDLYVIKTIDRRESKFLQGLLPGYYMNIEQNKNTLLPKFFGQYNYSSLAHNLRIVVMNNLLPSNLLFCEKYDIKGSTLKRRANAKELSKSSPTLKDLDFIDRHPNGFSLEKKYYDLLISTLERDARVLCSFKIMDYSLLIGVHKARHGNPADSTTTTTTTATAAAPTVTTPPTTTAGATATTATITTTTTTTTSNSEKYEDPDISYQKDINRRNEVIARNLRGLKVASEANMELANFGGLPAKTGSGEEVILFIGIIDILQNYRLAKKLEFKLKSFVHDGRSVSVNNPQFYQHRFLEFCRTKVFKSVGVKPEPKNKLYNAEAPMSTANIIHVPQEKLDDTLINVISEDPPGKLQSPANDSNHALST